MITVVNRHTWDNNGDVLGIYIGRGTMFGNPYSHRVSFGSYTVATREIAIEKYKIYMRSEYKKVPELRQEMKKLAAFVAQGGELVLICSCKPKACHGDVLKTAILNLIDLQRDTRRLANIRGN